MSRVGVFVADFSGSILRSFTTSTTPRNGANLGGDALLDGFGWRSPRDGHNACFGVERQIGMILVPLIVFLERRIEIFVDSLVDVVGVRARHLHFVHHAAAGPDDLLRKLFGSRFVRRVLDVA